MAGDKSDFLVNDDGTPIQDNGTGIDIEGDGLGHSDDDDLSTSDVWTDDWLNDTMSDDW